MSQSQKDIVACVLLFLLSLFIFTQGLDVHGLEYRDDEIFYFKSTQEMVGTGDIMSPTYFGENRFQKPILYYWLVLFSYKIFGLNWFGARFVAVVFAGLTVCVTWLMGKHFFNRRVATLSALILMTVPLFFRHAKNAVPDMALNFFIVWAIYCAVRFMQILPDNSDLKGREGPAWIKYNILFFIACALGFMIKGFAALIVPILAIIVFSLLAKKPKILARFQFGRGILIMSLIMCPWFFYMIKAHGQEYLNYMLVDETKNRLINAEEGNILIKMSATFVDHCLFYFNVIGAYFSPWCIFLIGGFPIALAKMRVTGKEGDGLRLMLVWFGVVFFFFSTMYFSINHYMLVLSTPFTLLVSYFLLAELDCRTLIGKIGVFLRKYMIMFMLTVGSLAFMILFVFLAGAAKGWLIALAVAYMAMMVVVQRSSSLMAAPLALSVFMLFVFAQSSLMDKAGVTSHSTLQRFAATINKEARAGDVIGVGSHDIHEKEFQAYFDQRILKAAGSEEDEMRERLAGLFQTNKKVYCLIIKKDFEHFLKDSSFGSLDIIQEDYILRRRMYIDGGFFSALLKLDQGAVRDYLKEKIILIRRDSNV